MICKALTVHLRFVTVPYAATGNQLTMFTAAHPGGSGYSHDLPLITYHIENNSSVDMIKTLNFSQ